MKKNILFIEDNEDFINSFTEIIKTDKYNIISGKDFRDISAIAEKAGNSPDYIVLDYSAVEDELIEISDTIRSKYSDCIIVLTTGRIDIKKIVTKLIRRKTIDIYLPKPYSVESLLNIIEK